MSFVLGGADAVRVKICGLSAETEVAAATEAGASYIGFVFYPPSPRSLPAERAAELCAVAPVGVCKVGLFVAPDDALLETVLSAAPLDMIQLHGDETPERVAEVRARYGLPVMKVVRLAGEEDVALLDVHEPVADQILCDAKPRAEGELPGGNGVAFDWRLIQGRRWRTPWMLAGGLTPENVARAIALTGATQVDVSSGVERAPGMKDTDKIAAFVAAAQAA